MKRIEIGRLLRSNIRACVVGCPTAQSFPEFGSLVNIPLDADTSAYGLISDIHIDDDGLVRQLVTSASVPDAVIQDNRLNRNVPVEMSVLFVGYKYKDKISYLLPPRPPLSLDSMYTCDDNEIRAFTSEGNFGYLRHILDAQEVSAADLLAVHLEKAKTAHQGQKNEGWFDQAVSYIIQQLRDDYPRLMNIMQAVANI